jgi:hypothetical protein
MIKISARLEPDIYIWQEAVVLILHLPTQIELTAGHRKAQRTH